LPKIGMRIIKSAVAVFICLSLYPLLGHHGVPFYAAIAAILCMQPDASNSYRVALNRIIGTLIGGVYGILVLTLIKTFMPPSWEILRYLVLSLSMIPLMYLTVLLKKNTATYITCVVFLSITVSHSDELLPYAFGISRIVETLIGIFVSLLVNHFHIPRRRNLDLLFVSDLNGTLLNHERRLSSYTRIKLNHLLDRGAQITVATSRTPATAVPLLNGVNLSLPIVVMNGAALYDLKEKTYSRVCFLPQDAALQVLELFERENINCLSYTLFDDMLHIYHGSLSNEAARSYFEDRKTLPLKSFIHGHPPAEQPVFYFTVFETLGVVEQLCNHLKQLPCADKLQVMYYQDPRHDGFYMLNVLSANASKLAGVNEIASRLGLHKTVVFGDELNDLCLLESTPHSYAVENAAPPVKETARHQIGSNDSDAVVRTIGKLFYSGKAFRGDS
jgi:HAD superfamily hydrolase (TIGR01484 family)